MNWKILITLHGAVPDDHCCDHIEVGGNMKLILDKHDIQVNTVFCLITAHIPINTQSSIFVVFRLQLVDLYLLLCKGICCGYPFELHRLVYSQHMLL